MSRPTKAAEPGTQVTISLRVPAELKNQLEERAAANHRNLSQECERALQRSFSPEALFVDSVAAMEGPAAHKKLADYLRTMAEETYGAAASAAGLAIMRQLSGYELYGRHFVPNSADVAVIRAAIAAFNQAIRESAVDYMTLGFEDIVPTKDSRDVRAAMLLRIANGEWKPNAAIPDESELAREFGVTLETVREALDLIEREGLIIRRTASPSKKTTGQIYLVATSSAA